LDRPPGASSASGTHTFKARAGHHLPPQRLPVKIVRDSYKDGRRAYEATFILVRPDRYIAWAGNEPPGDAAAILAKAAGRKT
jgi:4-hydroxyisophthalate hydroxylase